MIICIKALNKQDKLFDKYFWPFYNYAKRDIMHSFEKIFSIKYELSELNVQLKSIGQIKLLFLNEKNI